ncbi:MAG: MerR family transcriptional regulator [Candidatus Limnocylindrales bacterium]
MNQPYRHSLAELARTAGVTPRTVRYYIAQGLLGGANEPGPGAWYDADHLARLRLIRELQRQHLPLSEIRARIAGLTGEEIGRVLEESTAKAAEPSSSALDYIRGLLGPAPTMGRVVAPSAPASSAPAPVPTPVAALRRMSLATTVEDMPASMPLTSPVPESPPLLLERAVIATTEDTPRTNAPERSQWDRIAISDDIELHVRRPLSRLDHRRVERLITIARQVLGEEQP